MRAACQWCARWALSETQAEKHPAWWQSCCMWHREWDRIKQVPGKLQYNTFSAILLLKRAEKNKDVLSVLTSQNQSKPRGKKKRKSYFALVFCTNYNLLLTLVYSLNIMPQDVNSSTATWECSKVHASCQGLLLGTAAEWKKPKGLSELISLYSTNI